MLKSERDGGVKRNRIVRGAVGELPPNVQQGYTIGQVGGVPQPINDGILAAQHGAEVGAGGGLPQLGVRIDAIDDHRRLQLLPVASHQLLRAP